MQRLPRDRALTYRLDADLEPALVVAAGEEFVIETEDASSGLLTRGDVEPTPENLPYLRHVPAKANPVGGPVFVDGVPAGSRVAVDVLAVDVAPTGIAYSRPPISLFGDSRRFAEAVSEPFAVLVQHGAEEVTIGDRLRWPLRPMIGTLACAPEWEAPATSTAQGAYGGNIDVADVAPGATVYLQAAHQGALLFAGDVHGCQGDGEIIGIADESRSEVRLRARPVDGPPLPAPRIETADRMIALGIEKPLEAAATNAIAHLMAWLTDEHGVSARDAYLAVGLHSEFRLRVYQMTAAHGLRFVVGASLPRSFVGQ